MDKQAARDNAYREFSQQSASLPGDKYAFKKGFDAGYKSACGDWVRIETRLPEQDVDLLCYFVIDRFQKHNVAAFDSRTQNWWVDGVRVDVIAWMPIPPLTDNEQTD